MLDSLIMKMYNIQNTANTMMSECIYYMSEDSDGGKALTDSESQLLLDKLTLLKSSIADVSFFIENSTQIDAYNKALIKVLDVDTSQKRDGHTLAKNPLFASTIFNIKNLLEDIDDKIAEKCHDGVRSCLTGIISELDNFLELKEISVCLIEVRDTFSDITVVSDMMYDFEKFFRSVFLLHEELNIGIALGSIKSVLPPRADDDESGIEFF